MTNWYAGFAMCKECVTYDPNEKGGPTYHNADHGEEYELSLYPEFKYARNAVGGMMEYLVPEFHVNATLEDYIAFLDNLFKLGCLQEIYIQEGTLYHYSPKNSPYAFMLIREKDHEVIPTEDGVTFKVVADHSKCTVERCNHDTVQ